MNAIKKVIRILGSAAKLARAIGVSHTAIQFWRDGQQVPPARVIDIVRLSQGAVSPYDIRPDIYPDPDWMPPGIETNQRYAITHPDGKLSREASTAVTAIRSAIEDLIEAGLLDKRTAESSLVFFLPLATLFPLGK